MEHPRVIRILRETFKAPDEAGAILMTRNYVPDQHEALGSSDQGLGLDRIDTRTLTIKRIEPPSTNTVGYISDGRGAVRILERAVDRNPGNLYSIVMLAVAYATVGRQQEAERQAKNVRQRFPTFPRDQFGSALRDPALRAKLDHALEKAGL